MHYFWVTVGPKTEGYRCVHIYRKMETVARRQRRRENGGGSEQQGNKEGCQVTRGREKERRK